MLGVEKGGGGPTAPSVHGKNSATSGWALIIVSNETQSHI